MLITIQTLWRSFVTKTKLGALYLLITMLSTSLLAQEFNDRDLSNTLRQKKEGIIYIWSPGMPLSELGLVELDEITRKHSIQLITLVDPLSNNFNKDKAPYVGKWVLGLFFCVHNQTPMVINLT